MKSPWCEQATSNTREREGVIVKLGLGLVSERTTLKGGGRSQQRPSTVSIDPVDVEIALSI
jgi:hypothetical protein